MKCFWILGLCALIGVYGGPVAHNDVTCDWQDCPVECGSGRRRCDRSNGKVWHIDCHVQQCGEFEGCGRADIVFIFDSSASIGEQSWWRTKQFAIDVMKGLNVGADESRVACVTFSDHATTHWQFGEYNSEDELEEKLWALPWEKGVTNTQDALIHAGQIIENSARADVKHLVVILTDGVSNVKADNTIPQAEALHSMGIEVFSIGIGNIDADEVKGIASEPKATHFHYVVGYGALYLITNTVINETCTSASLTECDDWSDWSACELDGSCGTGSQIRTKECRFYLYPGAVPDIRIANETRSCEVPCPTTGPAETTTTTLPTTPSPTTQEPTAIPPSSSGGCGECDYDDHGVGYLPVEENCHLFIQCQRLQDGSFREYKKSCNELYWRQSILSCDFEKDPGADCEDGEIVPDNPDGPDGEEECDKSPGPSAGEYIWHTVTGVDYVMPCSPGTVFNQEACKCVHGDNGVDCGSDAMLEFPFATHYNDICNRAAGSALGNMEIRDGAAYFDGSSRVEVAFFKNYFAENPTSSLTLSLWFRYTGEDDDFRGLFSNGDCVDDASLMLAVGSGVAQGQVIADSKAHFGHNNHARNFERDEWVHLAMVYSGWDVKYYINGEMKSQQSISGNIANTQCAASIGFSGLNNAQHFFVGYIDDVRVYKKTLYDYDIGQLVSGGRH